MLNPLSVATDGLFPSPSPLSIATQGYITIAVEVIVVSKRTPGQGGMIGGKWQRERNRVRANILREDDEILEIIINVVISEVL